MTPTGRTYRVAAIGMAGLMLYLAWSWAGGHLGFPLDDAWIHQTYARNLVAYGEWSFIPGQPSAGSTAPLWTLLLAIGYVLGIPYRLWAYGLGGLCLLGTALLASRLADRLFRTPTSNVSPRIWNLGFAVGLACAVEWHLVWAAASGMETLLFALLALALWDRVVAGSEKRPFLTGFLGGALVLARPEGIIAVGLAVVGVTITKGLESQWRRGLGAGILVLLGTALAVAPYLALNYVLSGTLWPNTFYAKQAEYAVLLAQPLTARIWKMGTVPLIGGQVLLVPGLVWAIWQAARRQEQGSLGQQIIWWLPLGWLTAAVGVYALRLPVTYQHGRYLIPVIPIFLVYGVGGISSLRSQAAVRNSHLSRPRFWGLVIRAWVLSTAILFLAFGLLGAQAYRTDVAIIEEEMVAVARWVDTNTAPDALVAIHDIGAVGYFAQRPLLDMAGLVSPEVVPFIRDEERLLAWLEDEGADYLVTFPSWYPGLVTDPRLEEVYRTNAAVTVGQGGDNMAIYEIHWDEGR